MNKQVVSFLSLFSLVLVLSIYYVMVPANREIKSVDNDKSSNEDVSIKDASNLFFETLVENRTLRHEEVKNTQMEILASNEYSNEQKLEAHNKLTYEKLIEETEIGIENAMNDLNFNEIFVEKNGSHFYVTAYDSTLISTDDYKKCVSIYDSFDNYFSKNDAEDLYKCEPIINFMTF